MPNDDELRVTFLEDGTIKVETDEISGGNHMNAENFMAFLQEHLGGQQKRVKRKEAHHHQHGRQTVKH